MVQDLNFFAMVRDEAGTSHPFFWKDERFFDGPSLPLAILFAEKIEISLIFCHILL
jgi:hypothetical protein